MLCIVSHIQLIAHRTEGYSFGNHGLEFYETNLGSKFAFLSPRTLAHTILQKRYAPLSDEVLRIYSSRLEESLPDFLLALKQAGDPFYKRFLNPYGDSRFCKFKIDACGLENDRGLYLYCQDNRIVYVGITTDGFGKRINAGYGNISPKNCYLDGQATNCHLNSLINDSFHDDLSLWICALDSVEQIKSTETALIRKLRPAWNLALKPKQQSDRLYFTHCSASKNPDFKDSGDSTTPDVLYTSTRIQSFFDRMKEDDLPWAIFSDKYGFVFPSSLLQWYDCPPEDVTEADIQRFVDEAIDELSRYKTIVYCPGDEPIHETYQKLVETMRSRGLSVSIE